jgi:hypothetical protein
MVMDNRNSKANKTSTSKIVIQRSSPIKNSLRHLQEGSNGSLIDHNFHDRSPRQLPTNTIHNKEKLYGGGTNPHGQDLSQDPERFKEYKKIGNLSIGKVSLMENSWVLDAAFQVGRTDHSIDNLISDQDIAHIKLYARQASNMKLTYVTSHHLTHITTEYLRELLSHGTMIIDNVLNVFLDILCHSEWIHYLSTYFLTMLRLEKNWPRLKRWFSSSPEKTRPHKPAMDSTAILIPCHVGGNHWVALV